MKMQYIEKIRSNISISASKKTTNLLEGLYRSVFKGRSMDFDDLRDYVIGDNNKDIDWKSSIRHGSLLVRRFIAFKRHNILFLVDTGSKFKGLSSKDEVKKELSLYTYGTLAYLVNKNEDEISTVWNKNGELYIKPFKTGLVNIEMTINELDKTFDYENRYNIEEILKYALDTSKRKMIFVVISDLKGMNSLSDSILKRTVMAHDLLFINIEDASLFGKDIFDIDERKNVPKFISSNRELGEYDAKIKREIYEECVRRFKKYRISSVSIGSKKDIVASLIDLLERHNHAIGR